MKIPRSLWVVGRLCFVAFILLTSTYCLLTYVPFTYHQIHLGGLFPWVTTFVNFHAYFYWGALAIVSLTLAADLEQPRTKALTLAFLFFSASTGLVLLFYPWLQKLRNDASSLLWGLAALVPLVWVAAIDWKGHAAHLAWADSGSVEDDRVFRAAWQSGIYLALLYVAIFYVRYSRGANFGLGRGERLLIPIWSLVDHVLIFMAIFVTVTLVRTLASFFARPWVEFLLCNLAAVLLITLILHSLAFPPLSFSGAWAGPFALAVAVSLVAANAGVSARLHRPQDGPLDSGLALLLAPMTFGHLSRRAPLASLLLMPGVTYFLVARAAVMDWNYLLQKLSALLVWTVTFACFHALAPRVRKPRTRVLLFCAVTILGAHEALVASQPRWKALLSGRQSDVSAFLDRYAGYDASFKLIHDMLSPVHSTNVFYRFLTQNTNLPQSVRVDPVEVNLVESLTESGGLKPNIFIFVIDSLRRDYVSCYKPSVTFTPSLDAFARESTVMQNAFTRYGGTGLSEPSLWAGAALLHKQYVTPFYPMNALQRLIEVEKYRSYVSKDSILSVILAPSPSLIELDKGIGGMNYDFCQTLHELTEKLRERKDTARPVFAYTQPQNIHISVINREGRSVPAGESYPGFDSPYASRLRRIDGCFGQFVKFLKTNGLYDNSAVILTSDHGDSLGEDGRWGHAYTLFPEIVRIPLIIRLPPSQNARLAVDTGSVSFLTDITPSLYYLLGHRPVVQNELFGRPLFTTAAAEQARYLRDSYMITSSYGPVYGLLKNGGRSLFVVDAVNYEDYLFTLGNRPNSMSEPITPSLRAEDERLIRDDILAINRFYKFGEP